MVRYCILPILSITYIVKSAVKILHFTDVLSIKYIVKSAGKILHFTDVLSIKYIVKSDGKILHFTDVLSITYIVKSAGKILYFTDVLSIKYIVKSDGKLCILPMYWALMRPHVSLRGTIQKRLVEQSIKTKFVKNKGMLTRTSLNIFIFITLLWVHVKHLLYNWVGVFFQWLPLDTCFVLHKGHLYSYNTSKQYIPL